MKLIDVIDFPSPNFLFRDVTPIFLDPPLYQQVVSALGSFVKEVNANLIVAPELIGSIFAVSVAHRLSLPFIIVRKPNKLPRSVFSVEYQNEYRASVLEIHQTKFDSSCRAFIIDDVISTGGTLRALTTLISKINVKVVGAGFLFATVLASKQNLSFDYPIYTIARYDE